MKITKKLLKLFFIILFIFIIINTIGTIYAKITSPINIKSANQFFIYDNNENLITTGQDNKYWISLTNLNKDVINATISVEDKNFYNHNGFDYLRIAKAILSNFFNGKIVQGASTITQQYAKNLFLDFNQTWERKWKEMWLTYKLETEYNKDEILEGYLNTINYGHGIYGIGKASKYYFNKDINDLDLAEISILVGIPNSPENYSPTNNLELSKERQEIVLERMLKNNYITKSQKEKAQKEELTFVGDIKDSSKSANLYYKDAVLDEIKKLKSIPETYLETGGIKIYTNLDQEAEDALETATKLNSQIKNLQTAKIMMESESGKIIALIGGTNYETSTYNRAIWSVRQPGSLLKPFLYYKAIENGLTPSSLFSSSKTTFNFSDGTTYSPTNSGNIYANKDITMALALSYSDNIYAIKTDLFLGEEELYKIIKDLGITSNIKPTPSLALGSYDVNIKELTGLYASLSNLGKTVKPHLIEKVYDINNNLIYEYQYEQKQLLNPDIVFIINELLTGTYDSNLISYTYPTCISMVSNLTNKYALKSGSTDYDSWIIGFDHNYVLASWVGFDNNEKINTNIVLNNKNSWSIAMETYLKDKDSIWYEIPDNISALLINPINGKIATNNSSNKKILYYLKGTEPTETDE